MVFLLYKGDNVKNECLQTILFKVHKASDMSEYDPMYYVALYITKKRWEVWFQNQDSGFVLCIVSFGVSALHFLKQKSHKHGSSNTKYPILNHCPLFTQEYFSSYNINTIRY